MNQLKSIEVENLVAGEEAKVTILGSNGTKIETTLADFENFVCNTLVLPFSVVTPEKFEDCFLKAFTEKLRSKYHYYREQHQAGNN